MRNKYAGIKEKILNAYQNGDEIAGLSVRREVGINDEWCAEAYMETDYSTLSSSDFERKIKEYVAFNVLNG